MQHVFLSPHFDDAALSCGGQIAQLATTGASVVMATIFGGRPDPSRLSSFAQQIHARPLAGADPMALRRQEERQAAAIMGAAARPGDYLDAIYRQDESRTRWLYDSEEAIFGPVDASEEGLAFELAQIVAAFAPPADRCLLYAPLALGNHVDHQLLRQAAMHLLQAGYALRFYEDYPYATRDPHSLEAALSVPARERWHCDYAALSGQDLQRKIEAVQAYGSQLGALFEGGEHARENVAPAITAFAHQVGAAHGLALAERLWRLASAPAAGS